MKPTVQFIRQQTNITATGAVEYSYSVSFMVGTHGPFTLQFTQAEFTPANVKEKVNAFAAQITDITAPAGS